MLVREHSRREEGEGQAASIYGGDERESITFPQKSGGYVPVFASPVIGQIRRRKTGTLAHSHTRTLTLTLAATFIPLSRCPRCTDEKNFAWETRFRFGYPFFSLSSCPPKKKPPFIPQHLKKKRHRAHTSRQDGRLERRSHSPETSRPIPDNDDAQGKSIHKKKKKGFTPPAKKPRVFFALDWAGGKNWRGCEYRPIPVDITGKNERNTSHEPCPGKNYSRFSFDQGGNG